MDDLKPCPFCGKDNELYSYQEVIGDEVYRWIYCGHCYTRGPRIPHNELYRTNDETKVWNTMCGGCKPEIGTKEEMYEVTIAANAILDKDEMNKLIKTVDPRGFENMNVQVRRK